MNELVDRNVGRISFVHGLQTNHAFCDVDITLGRPRIRHRIKRSAMGTKEGLAFGYWPCKRHVAASVRHDARAVRLDHPRPDLVRSTDARPASLSLRKHQGRDNARDHNASRVSAQCPLCSELMRRSGSTSCAGHRPDDSPASPAAASGGRLPSIPGGQRSMTGSWWSIPRPEGRRPEPRDGSRGLSAFEACSARFRTIQIWPKDLKATPEADSAAAQD
jgi:hypothetical protein